MNLDTRGLMDGALKGFDAMDRHYERQAGLKMADERMQMERERNKGILAMHDQQMKLQGERAEREKAAFDAEYGVVGSDGKRTGGWRAKKQAQEEQLFNANLAASNSATELNKNNLERQKRMQTIQDNISLLEEKWNEWGKTGTRDPIFDNKYIKGSAYDPERYLDKEHDQALGVIENKLPGVIKNPRSLDEETISALGVIYKNQVRQVVGQQDPITGKTIKDAKLGGVTLAGDIDPNQPGDQPGIVLTTLVNYGDGKWVAKPITKNRSTHPDDHVMVIPLSGAMQDITGQLKKWRIAKTADARRKLFGQSNTNQQATKQYHESLAGLTKEKFKATNDQLSNSLNDPKATQQKIAAINDNYNQAASELKSLYFGNKSGKSQAQQSQGTQVPQWANGDQEKLAFAQALNNKGLDVGTMTVEQLNDLWDNDRNEKMVAQYKKDGQKKNQMTAYNRYKAY